MYPRITERSYGYLNAGVGSNNIFPSFRFGGELYQVFSRAFELSAGIRFLAYETADVWVYTGSVSKYHRNYWLSYRALVTAIENEQTLTHQINARRYFGSRYHYVGLWAVYGNAPVQFVTLNEIRRLNSSIGGLDYQFSIATHTTLRVATEFQREEFIENEFRNRLSIELTLAKRF